MSTLHILSNPTSPVHINNRIDPFSVAVVKFITNMTQLGWNCVHYSVAGSEVECESVVCLDVIDPDRHTAVDRYNRIAAEEIKKRKKLGDLIMCFHGWENRSAAEANSDLIIVEPSIGYETSAVFAPYRVFVSYAQMHMFYGQRDMLMSPSWFDAVIPNAFTPSEFEFNAVKKDYILYFGRVIENKGIHIAIQATAKSGHKLIIAGPGELSDLGYKEIPSHVTCVGLVGEEQRRTLMRDATAIIGPTYYVEPFGNMVVEGYFSGTPAITSDWGGFTETVVHGVTGFRCRDFNDFVDALNNINQINPAACRDWAWTNYEETVVHRQFDRYFKKLQTNDFYGGNKI
jgi:glycosyltransferase involved in cell wall biosynthesis